MKVKDKSHGHLIVISGPSGVGKDSVVSKIRSLDGSFFVSVSVTSRSPRHGEADGVDYYFVSLDEFKSRILKNDFLEFVCYCGNYYGTLKSSIDAHLNEGFDVILVIDIDGAKKVKSVYTDCFMVFILPPSFDDLRERIVSRGLDDPELIESRLKRAEIEIRHSKEYDLIVTNDAIDDCARKILNEIRNLR